MENIYLTEKQAAERYQLSTKTLHNWRKAEILVEGIQYFYAGKQIRYIADELHKYFNPQN